MNDTDYFSWILAFNSYKEKHPETKFYDLLSSAEGVIKMRRLIENMYADKLETHSIKKLIKKAENRIEKKELNKLIAEIEKEDLIEIKILKKLESYKNKDQNFIYKNKLNSKTNLLTAVETIKENISKGEDINDLVEDYFQKHNEKTSSKKTKKEVIVKTDDDLSEDDLFDDIDDIDDIDEIDNIEIDED